MRKPVLLIFSNACILIVVFALLSQSLFIVQRVTLAHNFSGQVRVQRAGVGAFTPLTSGTIIQSGDRVTTGAKSWGEFGWLDGTRWRLAPDSSFIIEKAVVNPAKKEEISRFLLEKGRVLMRIVKPMAVHSHFQIETPQSLIATRGAVFSVSTRSRDTQVKVFQGAVDVTNLSKSRKIQLMSGRTARVSLLSFKTVADLDQSEFLVQPGFTRPNLQVSAQLLGKNGVLLQGQTEAGDQVTIDGANVPVLSTGTFIKRVNSSVLGTGWKIESTDGLGGKTVLQQRPPF